MSAEADLLRRAQGGDKAAADAIYSDLFASNQQIQNLLLREVPAPGDREDLQNGAFSLLLRSAQDVGDDPQLREKALQAVQITILQQRRSDRERRRKTVRLLADLPIDESDQLLTITNYGSEKVTSEQMADRLYAVLPEPYRTALRLRTNDELNYLEVARRTNSTPDVAAERIFKARSILYQLFGGTLRESPPGGETATGEKAAEAPAMFRVVRCADPARFQTEGYWASQGAQTENQVRWDMLWQSVIADPKSSNATREHAEQCDYCGDVMDRMRSVLHALKPGRDVVLLICPSAADLVAYQHEKLSGAIKEKISGHLQKCKLCAREFRWLAKSDDRSQRRVLMTPRARMIALTAAAAVLVMLVVPYAVYQNRHEILPIVDHAANTKYRDLAHLPRLDRDDLNRAAPASHLVSLDKAMSAAQNGDTRRAVSLAANLINDKDEPAAEYVLGMALYKAKMAESARDALFKSEEMSPRSAYRCWTALQIALIMGDKAVAVRECDHLANNPQYHEQAQTILDELKRRG